MTTQQLPPELLESIFQIAIAEFRRTPSTLFELAIADYTQKQLEKELNNFSLVCRSWRSSACRVLYERLEVKDFKATLKRLARQKANFGIFCRTLHFKSALNSEVNTSEDYRRLLSYLPNVSTIILSPCEQRIIHLNQIAHHSQLLKFVQSIETDALSEWSSHEQQAYYNCMNHFKHTLKRLQIPALDMYLNNKRGGNVANATLSSFTSLTKLELEIREPYRCPSMFTILRMYPSLIIFKLTNGYPDYKLDDADINCAFKHKNLKELDIGTPALTQQHIEYMCANITGLTQFRYHPVCYSYTEPLLIKWLETIDRDKLVVFQQYLARIEVVDFAVDFNPSESMPFYNGIIGNDQSIPTHMTVELENNSLIVFSKRKTDIRIHFGISSYELQPDYTGGPFELLERITSWDGFNVRSFHVSIARSSVVPEALFERVGYQIFKTAIDSFTNLYDLSLTFHSIYGPSYALKVSSRDIRQEKHRYLLGDFLRSFSSQSNKLAYVSFGGVSSAKNMVSEDAIASIVERLPDTKYLKIMETPVKKKKQLGYFLNLGNLNLQRLICNISGVVDGRYCKHSIVLMVVEKELDRNSLYTWTRKEYPHGDMVFELVESKNGGIAYRKSNTIIIHCQRMKQITLFHTLKDYDGNNTSVTLDLPDM